MERRAVLKLFFSVISSLNLGYYLLSSDKELAAEEDLKKLERRVKSSEKKMIKENELPKKIQKNSKK